MDPLLILGLKTAVAAVELYVSAGIACAAYLAALSAAGYPVAVRRRGVALPPGAAVAAVVIYWPRWVAGFIRARH